MIGSVADFDFTAVNLHSQEFLRRKRGLNFRPFLSASQYWLQGEIARTQTQLQETIRKSQDSGDQRNNPYYLGMLATFNLSLGERSEAAILTEEAVALARATGDRWCLGLLLKLHAEALNSATLAQPHAEESRELLEEVQQKRTQAAELLERGRFARLRGKLPEANSLFQESLTLYREAGDWWGQACLLSEQSRLAGAGINRAGATSLGQAAVRLADQVHRRPLPGNLLWFMGYKCLNLGDYPTAQKNLEEALQLARTTGDADAVWLALTALGELAELKTENSQAAAYYREALVLLWRTRNKSGLPQLILRLARTNLSRGKAEQAFIAANRSLPMFQKLNQPAGTALNLEVLAGVMLALENPVAAGLLLARTELYRQTHQLTASPFAARFQLNLATRLRQKLSYEQQEILRSEGLQLSLEQTRNIAQRVIEAPQSERYFTDWLEFLTQPLKKARHKRLTTDPEIKLTHRESEVLSLVAQGLTDAETAEAMGLSPLTVSSYLRSVYAKLGVKSRTAAVHQSRLLKII